MAVCPKDAGALQSPPYAGMLGYLRETLHSGEASLVFRERVSGATWSRRQHVVESQQRLGGFLGLKVTICEANITKSTLPHVGTVKLSAK